MGYGELWPSSRLARRDLVKLNANAFNMDPAYEADDGLLTLAQSGPSPLTFTLNRNHSGQITALGASNGAFLSRPVAVQTTAYVPDRLNRYTSVGGTAYGYDANGNLTSDGTTTYEYDEENRLRSAVGGGFTTSYEYDPLGRRRAKVVNGVTTKFVSDNAEEVEERDGANALLRKYVYGSGVDERIAMLDTACSGGRCYYLTNWQGSTTTLVNQTGSTLNATYHYGPYGEGTNWTPADALTGNPFRYTGRRVDPETGLYYYRARYYSPKLGRFLQTDPVGTKDDLNLYTYVGNDPLNQVDPKGLCSSVKDEAKRTDCLEKRANAVAGAKNYLAAQSVRSGTDEAAYIATYNEDTGDVSVRTGDAAGKRTGDDVGFSDSKGKELRARPDGRITDRGVNGKSTDTNEIVLATGHGHTKDSGGGRINALDNANESIRSNPADKALSRIAPAVIKTPSGKIKVFQNEKEIKDEY